MLGGALDARGDALERNPEILEPRDPGRLFDEPSERPVGMHVRTAAHEIGRSREDRAAEDSLVVDVQPDLAKTVHHLQCRLGCDRGPVECTDGGADDEVGTDAVLEERAQHADLVRAVRSAAAEDERDAGCARVSPGRQR
jgi:hypothetical protein